MKTPHTLKPDQQDDIALSCVYCGRRLNAEEVGDPYRDETGDIICDSCYSEHYEYLCPLCQNLVAIEGNEKHIIVPQALASDQRMEPGIYRVAALPWFSSNYFSMRINQSAVSRESDLPEEASDMDSGDYVCEMCVSHLQQSETKSTEAIP